VAESELPRAVHDRVQAILRRAARRVLTERLAERLAQTPDGVHLAIGDSAATMRLLCGVHLRDSSWTRNPVLVTCPHCQQLLARQRT
jgi:hypothetical protein